MEGSKKTPEESGVDGKHVWAVGGFVVIAFVVVIGAITLASKYGGGFWSLMGTVVVSFVVIAVLAKEIASGKPRRKWYELSVEGLCDAAKAVGEVGEAVVKAVAKLGPLVAGMLA